MILISVFRDISLFIYAAFAGVFYRNQNLG